MTKSLGDHNLEAGRRKTSLDKNNFGWYSNAFNSDKLSLVEIYLTKVYPVGGHSVFPETEIM
ncbi:hypothetical protein ACBZ91_03100 [Vibrio natriegens]|uniref:hypothetical protein n=1 Tax=Vibrio natriegens TaxID=691 RepID=UPI003555DFDC